MNYVLNLNDFKNKIIIDALWNQIIITKYKGQITIDEKKIKQKLRAESNEKQKEYQLSEIIFEIKNKEEIEKKYAQILKNISENGFENSASLFSFSDSSKIGGDIGWIQEKSLNKIIKMNIEKLNIG